MVQVILCLHLVSKTGLYIKQIERVLNISKTSFRYLDRLARLPSETYSAPVTNEKKRKEDYGL